MFSGGFALFNIANRDDGNDQRDRGGKEHKAEKSQISRSDGSPGTPDREGELASLDRLPWPLVEAVRVAEHQELSKDFNSQEKGQAVDLLSELTVR